MKWGREDEYLAIQKEFELGASSDGKLIEDRSDTRVNLRDNIGILKHNESQEKYDFKNTKNEKYNFLKME